MEKLYLIDGSGYIFRAFYAVSALSNSKGLPTNAIFGFAKMLLKLLRECEVRYAAVTFDSKGPTFRHEIYPGYKANRAECPEDLLVQMPYFRRFAAALGLRVLEKPGVEADDIIATIVENFSLTDRQIVVVSGDKDLMQLVNDKVHVFDAMREQDFDPKAVQDKFGVMPSQIHDYLTLIGDSSDNVPGVRGVGPKTAQKLLEVFGSLAQVLANVGQVEAIPGLRGARKVREELEASGELINLSRELIQLKKDVDPFCSMTSLDEYAWEEPHIADLEALADELEFKTLMAEIPFSSQREGIQEQNKSGYAGKSYKVITPEVLEEFASSLAQQKEFAFDTETTSLDVLDCQLVGMSFSLCADQAFYLPLHSELEPDRALSAERVKELLGPILSSPLALKIGANLKFDIGVLEEHGYTVCGPLFDIMLCSYVLRPDGRQHGLKHLAWQYLKEEMETFEEVLAGKENVAQVPIDQLSDYACHDADAAWKLRFVLDKLLGEKETAKGSLRRAFEEVELPLVPALSRLERTGICIDMSVLEGLGAEFACELSELERAIYALAGREFNINSPKQLSQVLFEDLAIPVQGLKKTKSGVSTDASVLEKLAPDYEIAQRLLDYRELFKLKTTYIDALKRLAHPRTGRIHTSFNQAVAATGRLSSSEPNLQNIPIRNERGRRIRTAFVAAPGSVLLSADYSQIELRVLAHLSCDEALCEAFRAEEDIHLRTSRELFGDAKALGSESKHYRRVAKTINFGIIYGMGAFRLARDLRISRKEAQGYIDAYFGRYPRVLEYFESLRAQIEEDGYVETMFGRRRNIADIDTSGRDAGYAERSLLNAPIQGSAAEIIKLAMIRLDGRFSGDRKPNRPIKMVLQVHDELVFEVEDAWVEEAKEVVKKDMESCVELKVPLMVDVHVGRNWAAG